MSRIKTITLGGIGVALALPALAWAWSGYTDAGFLLLPTLEPDETRPAPTTAPGSPVPATARADQIRITLPV